MSAMSYVTVSCHRAMSPCHLEVDGADMSCFDDGTFDLVIDKGTLDAVICDRDTILVDSILAEVWRVLKSDEPTPQIFRIKFPSSSMGETRLCVKLNWKGRTGIRISSKNNSYE